MSPEEQEQLESYLKYAIAMRDRDPTASGKKIWNELIEQARKESATHDR